MRRGTLWMASGIVASALAGTGTMSEAVAQMRQQTLQEARHALQAISSGALQKFESAKGTAAAKAHPGMRKVWVTALNVPGQENKSYAGFKLAPLTIGGQTPGARVSATFNVSAYASMLALRIDVYEGGALKTHKTDYIDATGTYTLKTDPFTLQAGKQYVAVAWLGNITNAGGDYFFAVATIPEIKWEL
ncbi:MAG: hypothetical protein AB1625_03080 [Acidobacteriota bacterium]